MTSTLFESFMIFYLLEVLILSIIAFQVFREIKQEETEENIKTDQDKKGPWKRYC